MNGVVLYIKTKTAQSGFGFGLPFGDFFSY